MIRFKKKNQGIYVCVIRPIISFQLGFNSFGSKLAKELVNINPVQLADVDARCQMLDVARGNLRVALPLITLGR